jgi:FkbM family methyltransferase
MRQLDGLEKLMIGGFTCAVLLTVGISGWLHSWSAHYAGLKMRIPVDSRCTSGVTQAGFARFAAEVEDAIATQRQPSEALPDNGLFRWETPKGTVWTPAADEIGGIMAGIYFRQPRWVTIDATDIITVRPGDVVMDAGAHLGESTRYAVQLGASLVIAVEPVAANLQALRRNLATQIAAGRVVIIEKGVYDREGVLSFTTHQSWDGSFHEKNDVHGGEADAQLPITTVDAIVMQLKLARLDFIKMDIEGSEPYALAGARETLKRFKPRLAIGTYHKPGDLEAIHRVVMQANPEYRELPSRCFIYKGRIFPNLLFYY